LLEEFGWGSPGLGLSILTDSFPATAVLMYQSENKRLINDIVIPLVKDLDVKTGACWAITEPDHGSDVAFCFTRHFPPIQNWLLTPEPFSRVTNGSLMAEVRLDIQRACGNASPDLVNDF